MSALALLDCPRRLQPASGWSFPPLLHGIVAAVSLLCILPLMSLLRAVALGLRIPGRQNILTYGSRIACASIGIRLHVAGKDFIPKDKQPRMWVANHCSWLDIVMLSGTAPVFYIAWEGVRHWPLFGFFARIGETEFISQSRGSRAMIRERERIAKRLDRGEALVMFPEGGRSGRLRPRLFHSAMLIDKTAEGSAVEITPVSICYVAARGLPLGGESGSVITTRRRSSGGVFGTIWRLLRLLPMDVVVELHAPVVIDDSTDRRTASDICHRRCADGVRRNRRAWAFYAIGDSRALDETLPLKAKAAA